MYDIDAGRSPSLRLDAPSRADLQAERAEIRRQIDALWVRYCDLVLESDTQEAQSQPIPVSDDLRHNAREYLGLSPVNGNSAEYTAPISLTMSHDFWTHRHRTMAGPDPLVARSNGYVEPISRR